MDVEYEVPFVEEGSVLRKIPLWVSSTFTLLIAMVGALAAWIWLDEPLAVY